MKAFSPVETYTKENGIKVTKFKPNVDIEVPAIDPKTGKVEWKRVVEFSKHENLKMYKIEIPLPNGDKEIFWASEDHSLIVLDIENDKIIKISPKDLIPYIEEYKNKSHDKYAFIRMTSTPDKRPIKQPSKHNTLAGNVMVNGCEFIPVSICKIEYNPSITVGYDFTVEDYYTFATENGIFVQDTFAMYMPLTEEALEDTREKMAYTKNLLVPGSLAFDGISQNVIYGIYKITSVEPDANQIKKEYSTLQEVYDDPDSLSRLTDTIKVNNEITTVARAIVSYALGYDKPINESMNKKKLHSYLTKTLQKMYIEGYDYDINRIYTLFLLGSAVSKDLTLTLEDFIVPQEMKILLKEVKKQMIERLKQNPRATTNASYINALLKDLTDKVFEVLGQNLKMMIESGAKGSKSQIRQMFVAKGYITDIDNKIVREPILTSLQEGLTPKQFLIMCKASRKGSVDRSVRTSEPGYLTRKLIFVLNPVEADIYGQPCDTEDTLTITLTEDNKNLFIYRYIKTKDGDILLTPDNIDKFVNTTVELYSPIFCKYERLCPKCFGEYGRYLRSPYVGMIASQALGERATQLIMRTFHTGGSAETGKVEIPTEIFKEIDGQIYAKSDIILLDEVSYGTTSTPLSLSFTDGETEYTMILPSYTEIYVESGGNVKISEGTLFAKLPDTSSNIVGAISYVETILESGSEMRDKHWKDIYMDLLNIFGDLNVLSVWYEILVSQIMRDPTDPTKLWRLMPDRDQHEPKLHTIRQIPFFRPLLAIAFQNIGKSLSELANRIEIDIHDLTILERIFVSKF